MKETVFREQQMHGTKLEISVPWDNWRGLPFNIIEGILEEFNIKNWV